MSISQAQQQLAQTQQQLRERGEQIQQAEAQVQSFEPSLNAMRTQRFLRQAPSGTTVRTQQARLKEQERIRGELKKEAEKQIEEYKKEQSQYESEAQQQGVQLQQYLESPGGMIQYARENNLEPVRYETRGGLASGGTVEVPVYETPYGTVVDETPYYESIGSALKTQALESGFKNYEEMRDAFSGFEPITIQPIQKVDSQIIDTRGTIQVLPYEFSLKGIGLKDKDKLPMSTKSNITPSADELDSILRPSIKTVGFDFESKQPLYKTVAPKLAPIKFETANVILPITTSDKVKSIGSGIYSKLFRPIDISSPSYLKKTEDIGPIQLKKAGAGINQFIGKGTVAQEVLSSTSQAIRTPALLLGLGTTSVLKGIGLKDKEKTIAPKIIPRGTVTEQLPQGAGIIIPERTELSLVSPTKIGKGIAFGGEIATYGLLPEAFLVPRAEGLTTALSVDYKPKERLVGFVTAAIPSTKAESKAGAELFAKKFSLETNIIKPISFEQRSAIQRNVAEKIAKEGFLGEMKYVERFPFTSVAQSSTPGKVVTLVEKGNVLQRLLFEPRTTTLNPSELAGRKRAIELLQDKNLFMKTPEGIEKVRFNDKSARELIKTVYPTITGVKQAGTVNVIFGGSEPELLGLGRAEYTQSRLVPTRRTNQFGMVIDELKVKPIKAFGYNIKQPGKFEGTEQKLDLLGARYLEAPYEKYKSTPTFERFELRKPSSPVVLKESDVFNKRIAQDLDLGSPYPKGASVKIKNIGRTTETFADLSGVKKRVTVSGDIDIPFDLFEETSFTKSLIPAGRKIRTQRSTIISYDSGVPPVEITFEAPFRVTKEQAPITKFVPDKTPITEEKVKGLMKDLEDIYGKEIAQKTLQRVKTVIPKVRPQKTSKKSISFLSSEEAPVSTSSFYGKGTYEKTSGGLLPGDIFMLDSKSFERGLFDIRPSRTTTITAPFSSLTSTNVNTVNPKIIVKQPSLSLISESKIGLEQDQFQNLGIEQRQQQRQEQFIRQNQRQEIKLDQRLNQEQRQNIKMIQEMRIEQRQQQRQEQRQITRAGQRLRIDLVPKPVKKIKIKITDPKDEDLITSKKRKSKKVVREGFEALVRRKGKFKPISAFASTKEEAFALGASKVLGTAAATFKIAPSKKPIRVTGVRPSSNALALFTPPKSGTPNVFVQRKTARIVSSGEKREISQVGAQVRRRGGTRNKITNLFNRLKGGARWLGI